MSAIVTTIVGMTSRAARRRAGIAAAARQARRLRADQGGAAAIEFAMIGMPFLMLLCAVFEAGLVTLAQQSLDQGLDRAARQLFTGSFHAKSNGTPSAERFRSELCPSLVYVTCDKVLIEVTTAASFGARRPTEPYDSRTRAANPAFGRTFQCPGANDIVTVRAAATVPRYFGFLTLNGLQTASNEQMVISTSVFRAEPYPSGRC